MKKRTAGLAAIARHVSQFAAGALVTYGVASPGMEPEIAGAIMTVATLIWFQFDRASDAADDR